jgi:hypothetical protein
MALGELPFDFGAEYAIFGDLGDGAVCAEFGLVVAAFFHAGDGEAEVAVGCYVSSD